MKSILHIADGPGSNGGAPPPPPKPGGIEDLKQQLALKDAKIVELTTAQIANVELEKKVAVKLGLGLTRGQALAVLRRQDEYDKSPHGIATAKKHAERQAAKTAPAAAPAK